MKFITLILILILFSTPPLNAEGLGDLNTLNTLGQLNLTAIQGGDFDPKVWERTIKKLPDEESQQLWYPLLLGQLNLRSMQGGDFDPKVWERTIKKLTDEESQKLWRVILNNQKLLKSLSN